MRLDDELFVNRCLQGDQAAFTCLVSKYKEMVHAYAYYKVGDYQEAQDIAQEVFIKAYSRLGQLKWPHRFQSWLYSIVANECKMWLRKRSKEREQEVPLEDVPAGELSRLAMRPHDDEDIEETVTVAMKALPADNQLALSLYYMSNLSIKEIAYFLGTSPGNVKVKLHRARKQLGERLEDMLGKELGKKKLRSGFIITLVDSIRNMPIPSLPKQRPTRWMPIPISIGLALLIGIIGYGVSSGKDVSSDMPVLKSAEAIFEVSLLSDTNRQTILDTESEDISDLVAANVGTVEQTQPTSGTKSSGMVVRRVWENALDAYSVSPDGRYVSYINWDTVDLAIHDFETGENRDVTDEGHWGKNDEWPDGSIWSPDSKQIAYLWNKDSDTSQESDINLRIVGIDGSKPRVLHSSPAESGALNPRAWSRDGKHILAVHCKGEDRPHAHDFLLVSVADGSIRVLKSLGPGRGLEMSLSPDGRHIVYDSSPSEDSPERDIFLLAVDGGHEIPLVEHPADDGSPFWAPDGNRIVFTSDRSGSMGLWGLEVVDGKPKGSPQLIKQNLNGIFPLGLTQDGSYYYGLPGSDADVYVATLDPKTGEVVTPPAKAAQSFEGFNYAPAFSPDGKRLAYVSRRPRGGDKYFTIIVIRSLETGEERELSPELRGLDRLPRWSPDGRSILALANGEHRGLYQIDAETDAATLVVLNDGRAFDEHGSIPADILPVWSPDGNRIFFARRRDGIVVIRAYDFETEREWSLEFRSKRGKVSNIHALTLSPDGQQFAFVECKGGHSLQIAPSAGGETRELLAKAENTGYLWTPDGRYLLFSRRKDEATEELWGIPVEGGEPQKLDLAMRNMSISSVHPDGRRIAFTGPGSGRGNEIWVMENILPKSTASR